MQLYIDFVSLSSNCECDCVHMLGKFAYNVCYLYLSQITWIQVRTVHWNGTEAHWDKYTYLSFPKAQIQGIVLPSSRSFPSGKFANNYQVLSTRKASSWMKHQKLWSATQEKREDWTSKYVLVFLAFYLSSRLNSVKNTQTHKQTKDLICENLWKVNTRKGLHSFLMKI